MKSFFKKMIAAILTLSAAGMCFISCSKSDKSSEKVLYIYNWTYYTPEDVVKAFEEEYGVTVKLDCYASNEEMYTKIIGGAKGYDIVVPSQDYVSIMIDQGLLLPIDQEKFTNKDKINPKVLAKATYDPTMKYAVPYYLGAAGISVNKAKTNGNYERNWNIFADPQFKGHATMMDDMREVIGDALTHLGYSINTLNDKELQEAKDLVYNTWKPNLAAFDAEGFGKSFAEGNFWLCQGYAEVVFGEVDKSRWNEVDFFIPEEGGPCYLDSLCILKGAPHYDLANEFINYIHRPENYAKFLDFFNFPCYVNPEAEQYMTTTPLYDASQMDNCELKNDLGEGLDKYNEQWEKIRF